MFTLKRICNRLGLYAHASKAILVFQILKTCMDSEDARRAIVEELVLREKKWLSLRRGRVANLPKCSDPVDLVLCLGEEQWYGPVSDSVDENATWYIRSVFVPHWERSAAQVPAENAEELIRWLCFLRVEEEFVTLHWRGFSFTEDQRSVYRARAQFKYWERIPILIGEVEKLFSTQLEQVDLQRLIIHDLWDKYRHDTEHYDWQDNRIRAEAGGVFLSARSAGGDAIDLHVRGVRRFTNALRKSIELELRERFHITLPNPEHFDEVILRTLIQDFGALSYEFALEDEEGTHLFRGHSYFGSKPNQSSADSFPHINLFVGYRSSMEQLDFLLGNLRD